MTQEHRCGPPNLGTRRNTERSYRAGVITKGALTDALMSAEQAKSDFEVIAYKLMLRNSLDDD